MVADFWAEGGVGDVCWLGWPSSHKGEGIPLREQSLTPGPCCPVITLLPSPAYLHTPPDPRACQKGQPAEGQSSLARAQQRGLRKS